MSAALYAYIHRIKHQYLVNVLHCILFPDTQIMRKFKIVSRVDTT